MASSEIERLISEEARQLMEVDRNDPPARSEELAAMAARAVEATATSEPVAPAEDPVPAATNGHSKRFVEDQEDMQAEQGKGTNSVTGEVGLPAAPAGRVVVPARETESEAAKTKRKGLFFGIQERSLERTRNRNEHAVVSVSGSRAVEEATKAREDFKDAAIWAVGYRNSLLRVQIDEEQAAEKSAAITMRERLSDRVAAGLAAEKRKLALELLAPDPISTVPLFGESVVGQGLNRHYLTNRAKRMVDSAVHPEAAPTQEMLPVAHAGFTAEALADRIVESFSKQGTTGELGKNLSAIGDEEDGDLASAVGFEVYLKSIIAKTDLSYDESTRAARKDLYRFDATKPEVHQETSFDEVVDTAELNVREFGRAVAGDGSVRYYVTGRYEVVVGENGEATLIEDDEVQGFRKIFEGPGAVWQNVEPGKSAVGVIKTPKHVDGATALFAQYSHGIEVGVGEFGGRVFDESIAVVPVAVTPEGHTRAITSIIEEEKKKVGVKDLVNPMKAHEIALIARVLASEKIGERSRDRITKAQELHGDLPAVEEVMSIPASVYRDKLRAAIGNLTLDGLHKELGATQEDDDIADGEVV